LCCAAGTGKPGSTLMPAQELHQEGDTGGFVLCQEMRGVSLFSIYAGKMSRLKKQVRGGLPWPKVTAIWSSGSGPIS
jgi:hypothetical protein